MDNTTIKIFSDTSGLSQFAAVLFKSLAREAVSKRGKYFISLSGGNTPIVLFRLLASLPVRDSLEWDKFIFFWCDERCVPPTDHESNYYQAMQALLAHVPVPETNIFRVKGELDPQTAAEDYAQKLKMVAEPGLSWPQFDLVLLGLGEDGHTASLFPGSVQMKGISTLAVSARYQDRPANRVTMTPAVFNTARNVVFMVSGTEKASALAGTIAGPRDEIRFPAQRVRPSAGNLWWLLDESSASLLPDEINGIILQR